jgi:hypothetical protein
MKQILHFGACGIIIVQLFISGPAFSQTKFPKNYVGGFAGIEWRTESRSAGIELERSFCKGIIF